MPFTYATIVLTSFTTKLREIFDLEGSGRLILFSVLVGVVSGLGAAAFFWSIELFQGFVLGDIVGYFPPQAGSEPVSHAQSLPEYWWLVLLVPTLGGLVCGWIVFTFAPEAEGHGTDAVVKAFHHLAGNIRGRVPLVKAVSSIITIGTGGSAGREGPIAQIGAGFGSFVGRRLKLTDRERRVLLMAGAAGGIGAIFRAPLGGALFSVEVLYASTAIEFFAFVPCVCASVVAYSVFAAIFGKGVAFNVPEGVAFGGIADLPFYLVFAVLCAVVGYAYVRLFYGARDRLFRKIPIPNYFKPAIGGFLLGLIALYLPQTMAGGYGWIQQALDGNLAMELMALLVLAKIVATSVTISSGGSGGVFAPSLFIGAMLGGAFGQGCDSLFPGIAPDPRAFVLVGMGGFFAGVAKVPLTGLIMVSEMCGSYDLLVALMVVCFVNVALISQRWTLYEEQVSSLIDSPAHLGDFVVDILAEIRVSEVFQPDRRPILIREDMPLPEILRIVAGSDASYFPVVDRNDELVGFFSIHDTRTALLGDDGGGLVLASDLARQPVPTVTPDDNLHTALKIYTSREVDEIPVVSSEDPRKVLCMLPRGDVIAAYDYQMSLLRA